VIAADASKIDPGLRAELGLAWADDALDEHASIAAFARFSLELLALGAPPSSRQLTRRPSTRFATRANRSVEVVEDLATVTGDRVGAKRARRRIERVEVASEREHRLVGRTHASGNAGSSVVLPNVAATSEIPPPTYSARACWPLSPTST